GLDWLETGRPDVLAFRRTNGWTCVTNFGDEPFLLPAGRTLLASSPLVDGRIAGAATAWLQS
ncbi:MAG: alpha-amylase, partial [Actinomycetota bacterium]|nr:alpha-amylase [Actinomycetota bacterium]